MVIGEGGGGVEGEKGRLKGKETAVGEEREKRMVVATKEGRGG